MTRRKQWVKVSTVINAIYQISGKYRDDLFKGKKNQQDFNH